MAVSHTVGSNVFDILLCLGIPWLVKTTVWDYDSTVVINSHGLFVSCFFILGSIAVTLIIIYYYKWVLNKKVGCIYLFFYFIFMGISIYVEMNAFGKYNPPMCIVDTWFSNNNQIFLFVRIHHAVLGGLVGTVWNMIGSATQVIRVSFGLTKRKDDLLWWAIHRTWGALKIYFPSEFNDVSCLKASLWNYWQNMKDSFSISWVFTHGLHLYGIFF